MDTKWCADVGGYPFCEEAASDDGTPCHDCQRIQDDRRELARDEVEAQREDAADAAREAGR